MEPLLLLPGTLCDARLWRHQLAGLSEVADVRVGSVATHDTLAATAQALLAGAPPRFALAGLSLGGIVALEIARLAPHRLARLALLNTSARPLTPEQAAYWESLGAQVAGGSFGTIADTLLPPMLAAARQHDAALVAAARGMAHAVGREGFLRQVGMQLSRRDSRPLLAAIECPTLVVAGREDRTCPPERQREIAQALPNAALVTVQECGHLSPLEQPHAISALLQSWLQTNKYG